MQKFCGVKFRKDRVKMQTWESFSHELCLYMSYVCVELSPNTVCKCKAFFNPIYLTVCSGPRNLPMKAAPHTELPEIHPFSIIQY